MDTINQEQTDTQLEEVETQYMVDQYEALCRLEQNADFKKVILDGYFKDKAVEGVSMLATAYVQSTGTRPHIMEGLVAISNLEDHFATIRSIGGVAAQEVAEANGPEV